MADNLDQVVESPDNQRLATGFVFTEGPLWHPGGYWLFVDIRRAVIHKLTPGGQPEVFRDNSGGSNWLTFDAQGRLLMCEGDNRQITRMDLTGSGGGASPNASAGSASTGPTTSSATATAAYISAIPAAASRRRTGNWIIWGSTASTPTAR